MGWQKVILNIVMSIEIFFIKYLKIKQNRITFISLESNELTFDSKLIYEALDKNKYDIKLCLIKYKKNLFGQFLYFLNCIKQLYYVYTSKLIIITNNNFVVSNYKREGVQVLQLWHACGAIKKFGNVLSREYEISNYDYVLATSSYWNKPYSEAFGVKEEGVIPVGLPRNDELFNLDTVSLYKEHLINKYPILKDKKVILYAPTFRGNIYKGFSALEFDALKIIQSLPEDYVILYKYHPLLGDVQLASHERIINMNHEDTHQLFAVSDYLISDYSSIVFDYLILNKPILFYIPDYKEYMENVGVFVEISEFNCPICNKEEDVIETIINGIDCSYYGHLRDVFFKYQDDQSTMRVVQFINEIME